MTALHVVSTKHIQKLIHNALSITTTVDGAREDMTVTLGASHRDGQAHVTHALCKAISDLRHAADELDAERLSCHGWAQQ